MMRKVLISLAAAGSALAFATPAAAQPYGQPYGNAYGYNNYGQVRALQARIDSIQRQIEQLRARRLLSRDEVNGLRSESRDLERRLYNRSRNGLNYNELRNIEYRVARLEQHVRREVRDDNRWGNRGGYNSGYGYNNDRDRDGRDDRYEDDRGTRHD
jgi:opacity protein-like surface antigen